MGQMKRNGMEVNGLLQIFSREEGLGCWIFVGQVVNRGMGHRGVVMFTFGKTRLVVSDR